MGARALHRDRGKEEETGRVKWNGRR